MRTIIGSVESGKRRWLAEGFMGLSLAATATATALMVINLPAGSGQPVLGNLAPILLGLVYPAVGAIVICRQPRNAVGWLLSALGLSVALTVVASEYAIRGLLRAPGSLPAAALAAWLQSWQLGWWFAAAVALLLLVFPNGRLPSQRELLCYIRLEA